MNKCLILFVEGDTEIEFYRRVIADARQKRTDKRFDISIECKNVKGVGGFKIQPKYGRDSRFIVALCHDTDVFEFSPKPPVNWEEVEAAFRENGVRDIIHIRARHSIEDWFLLDAEGILSFLRLPKKTKISGGNGYEKLKMLFKQANKIYYKGMKGTGTIEHLNINKIACNVQSELASLYDILGVKQQ